MAQKPSGAMGSNGIGASMRAAADVNRIVKDELASRREAVLQTKSVELLKRLVDSIDEVDAMVHHVRLNRARGAVLAYPLARLLSQAAASGKERVLYFFSKEIKDGSLDAVPSGYTVVEMKTGLPVLKKV